MSEPTTLCPRCQAQPAGLGTSRLDSTTRICSTCDTDEALEDLFGSITPKHEWPVRT